MRTLMHEHVCECEHPKVRYRCSTRENRKKALDHDPAPKRACARRCMNTYASASIRRCDIEARLARRPAKTARKLWDTIQPRTCKQSMQLVSRYGVGNTSDLMCAIRYPGDDGLTAATIRRPDGTLKRPCTSWADALIARQTTTNANDLRNF